ncbi:MAG: hypothetical protein WCO56_13435 [Verrucomicrobiota bacterium]
MKLCGFMILTAGLIGLAGLCAGELPSPEQRQLALQQEFNVARVPVINTNSGMLAQRWLALARQETAALQRGLKPWSKDARAKLLTDGRSHEHGIRPNTQILIGLAIAARFGDTEMECTNALADLVAILHFVAPTHSAGPLTASDGKKWQNQWQSALWAAQAGVGAWLVWDRLDPELQWLTANLICAEADRFVDVTPPHQVKNDTKAEENAWDSMVISLAANMFSKHPRRAIWEATAIRWQLSSFVTEPDTRSARVVDGKPLKEWGFGPNIHEDYTLENHDRVHPSYMGAITLNQDQHLFYLWAGHPAPEALHFNAQPIYEHLKFFSHPDGRMHFPNGQDWELHRLTPVNHAVMNVLFKDREAAYLERATLETCEKMQQREPGGPTLLPQEYFFPSLPGMYVNAYTMAFLLHAAFGDGVEPVSAAEFLHAKTRVQNFEQGEFAVQRTPHGWASFSWGNRIMGQAIPFTRDLLGSPYEWSFIGTVEATPTGTPPQPAAPKKGAEYPRILKLARQVTTRYFSVQATLSRAGGLVEQAIVFVSLPDGTVAYFERFTARQELELKRLESCKLGVLNEPEWVYQRKPRRLFSASGERFVNGLEASAAFTLPSTWLNVDDAWGLVLLGEHGFYYQPTHQAAKGRREQFLFATPPQRTIWHEGEILTQRGLLVLLNAPASRTADLERSLKLENQIESGEMKLTLNGWRLDVHLQAVPPTLKIAE